MFKRFIAIAGLTALTSCGVVYISPKVNNADGKVRVVSLNAQSVLAANQSSYHPRELPAVFFQNAGNARLGLGAGASPPPTLERQSPPTALSLRIPNDPPSMPYEIGIGDVLLLVARGGGTTVEELAGLLATQNRRQDYTVQDDGAIAIPNVGRIILAGLSLEEAESALFQRLLENQIDPTFSLEIAEFNSKRVAIGGAVGSPTVAPITLTPLTLEQALIAAGGIQTADLDYASIRIYRDGALYQIPLTEYLRRGDLQKTRLIGGDSVYVDIEYQLARAQNYFAEQITLSQLRQGARATALSELESEIDRRRTALGDVRANYQARLELDAVGRDYAYVSGEVSKPGRFTLPFGRQATLADAIYSEGGFSTNTANPGQIYLLRGSADPRDFGALTAWHLDARNAANLVFAARMELRPNDIIFVAEQPVTKWNRTISQITPSLFTGLLN